MPKSKIRVTQRSKQQLKPIRLDITSVRRSAETFLIDPEKIRIPEWMAESDRLFIDLYKKYLLGRIPGFATRMPIDMIKEGFYLPSRGFEYLCDAPPEEIIQEQTEDVRQGARPALHLYANQNPNDNVRFLCPDDVAICIAYRRLGFRTVPAVVLSPGRRSLPFSSFETKAFSTMKDMGLRICGLVSAETPTELPSILGETLPSNPKAAIEALSHTLRNLIERLRIFHVHHTGQLHYHHMVFSAIVRLQETLQAIEILIENNLWNQALALLRVLYEIHLNFYFDWLQPEVSHRYLAAAAIFKGTDVARERRSMTQELIANGLTSHAAAERANLAWLPVTIASTVSEKARLPKIGILYHKDIYDFLSQISHQNFDIASLHANRFDDDSFLAIEEDAKSTYLRFIDCIVSEFVVCVDEDIGTPP